MLQAEYKQRSTQADDDGFELHLLDKESGAMCLDGTPAGYYIRRGHPNKWLVHLQGGGWCLSEADCLERAGLHMFEECPLPPAWGHNSVFGSSRCWPPRGLPPADGGPHGMFSSEQSVNPLFHDYTKVWLMYCDGGSFSGNRQTPVEHEGHHLHFAGKVKSIHFDSYAYICIHTYAYVP